MANVPEKRHLYLEKNEFLGRGTISVQVKKKNIRRN